jgi:hypothetical protein
MWTESWCLALPEEHRKEVPEKRVLTKIFGPRRGEVTGDWRKMHSEELHDLYCSPHIIMVIR